MQFKVLSTNVILPKDVCLDNISIEKELKQRYGEIVRWAIVFADENICKVSVSYKTEI